MNPLIYSWEDRRENNVKGKGAGGKGKAGGYRKGVD